MTRPTEAAVKIELYLKNVIIREGLRTLWGEMERAPAFDPLNPPVYGKKDEYFISANQICLDSLVARELWDLSERYYQEMLNAIKKHEKDNGKNLNKGMVYGNLGASQAAQGKIDEGFANILKSHLEDEPYHKTNQTVFQLQLYEQFEQKIRDYILSHCMLYQTEEGTTVDRALIDKMISSLNANSHILFISMVDKIRRHSDLLADKDNQFSRLQIFLSLQDLCLAIENALKVAKGINGTMKPLLDQLFSSTSSRLNSWKPAFDNNYSLTSSNDAAQLESNLRSILALSDVKARRLLVLCAVRNFSSHNVDVLNQYLFSNVRNIFDQILSSSIFLHVSGCF